MYSSTQEAENGSRRKAGNLPGKRMVNPVLNFAGINNELICESLVKHE
jgi:23S rRNA (adenine1618-N6)-methyltransferase